MAPLTIAYQALLSMECFRQEYWSRLPFASSGDLPHPGIKPRSPPMQAVSLPLSHWEIVSPTIAIIVDHTFVMFWDEYIDHGLPRWH